MRKGKFSAQHFLKGASKKQGNFCEDKEAVREKPECIGEYMRAHGPKSTMFGRAEGCEHAADAAITKKDRFLEMF